MVFKLRWASRKRKSKAMSNARKLGQILQGSVDNIYLIYSSSEMQDTSSSVLSSRSGKLPHSNTFTPGRKEGVRK